ncbi:MAG TPA: pilus assembly protein TadG-related protein [Caulifigura sp.]|nr:pilus assembly protein TadG-related protein [Caulifigura sp.]
MGRRGVTSILSLVAVMLFTMLLVMLTNVVRHADDKVRMQNAVDAATYSGAAVLARGMNSIAFANHLQSETLALTALLRALDDRGSQTARQLLPVMRAVLGTPETDAPVAGDHLLPNYQREVLALFPAMAQTATHEIAMRHGLPQGRLPAGLSQARTAPPSQFGSRGTQPGMLWQSGAWRLAQSMKPIRWAGRCQWSTQGWMAAMRCVFLTLAACRRGRDSSDSRLPRGPSGGCTTTCPLRDAGTPASWGMPTVT